MHLPWYRPGTAFTRALEGLVRDLLQVGARRGSSSTQARDDVRAPGQEQYETKMKEKQIKGGCLTFHPLEFEEWPLNSP
jgi:hypothetical protein